MKTDLEPLQYWGVFTLPAAAMVTGLNVLGAFANDLSVSVAYQPKTATGLAAGGIHLKQVRSDESTDSSVPGYEVQQPAKKLILCSSGPVWVISSAATIKKSYKDRRVSGTSCTEYRGTPEHHTFVSWSSRPRAVSNSDQRESRSWRPSGLSQAFAEFGAQIAFYAG
jgi:hypothetical protein